MKTKTKTGMTPPSSLDAATAPETAHVQLMARTTGPNASLPQPGDEVSSRSMKRRFGPHAIVVLENHLQEIDTQEGEPVKYLLSKRLPSLDEYQMLRQQRFTASLAIHVNNALEKFHCLMEELQEWQDNLPESLQEGEKAYMLETAISELDGLPEPAVPKWAGSIDVLHLPLVNGGSRRDRRDDTVSTLRDCLEALGILARNRSTGRALLVREIEGLMQEIGELIDAVENVEFPGMY